MAFSVGDVVTVRYNQPGRAIYHARLIVGIDPGDSDNYAVVTPDHEEFEEILDLVRNAELSELIQSDGINHKVGAIGRKFFHDFTSIPSTDEIHAWATSAHTRFHVEIPMPFMKVKVRNSADIIVDFSSSASASADHGKPGDRPNNSAQAGGALGPNRPSDEPIVPSPGGGLAALRAALGPSTPGTSRQKPAEDDEPPRSSDLRVCPVRNETSGARFRELREAIDIMDQVS